MERALSIALADSDPKLLLTQQAGLAGPGREVVLKATSRAELIEGLRDRRVDVAVAEVELLGTPGLEAAEWIARAGGPSFVLTSARPCDPSRADIMADWVAAYLTKPIHPDALLAAVILSALHDERFKSLRHAADSLRQALDDRRTIDRAKGLLMRRRRLDEDHALRSLQRLARAHNIKLVEMARRILNGN